MKRLIFLGLIFIIGLRAFSADYVDNINNATAKRAEGSRIIYEMNVGSFSTEGTFAAAQARLGELKTLGVDIVWLMPIWQGQHMGWFF